MKKIVLTILLLLLTPAIVFAGGWKFYVFGVDLDLIKESDWSMMALGAIASVATHGVGHYIAAELVGADMHQRGIREVVTNSYELSNSDERWIARGGFFVQSLVNTVLTSFKSIRKSKFMKGYTVTTLLETSTYSMRWKDEGDFIYLKKSNGGNANKERSIYYAVAVYNAYLVIK